MTCASSTVGSGRVVALNDGAEVFLALASQIEGAAVGWTPSAISLLRDGLKSRFGDLLGASPDRATRSLIEIATTPVST